LSNGHFYALKKKTHYLFEIPSDWKPTIPEDCKDKRSFVNYFTLISQSSSASECEYIRNSILRQLKELIDEDHPNFDESCYGTMIYILNNHLATISRLTNQC
jgi:hypothetical protein